MRALPHCGHAAGECAYMMGAHHQQHTHGIYVRTAQKCNGKPVYKQQTNGDSLPAGDGEGSLYLHLPRSFRIRAPSASERAAAALSEPFPYMAGTRPRGARAG